MSQVVIQFHEVTGNPTWEKRVNPLDPYVLNVPTKDGVHRIAMFPVRPKETERKPEVA